MSYAVVLISALVCELHDCTYMDTRIPATYMDKEHGNVTEAGSFPADSQGWHVPVEPLWAVCLCCMASSH